VDIALDSIQVLMHLNATTDIYSLQQNAFNYFLLSSLAIIFLAVCHAPEVFAGPCRKSFVDAVELVRSLSHCSLISRRLWKSIRGLLPRLKRLGLQRTEQGQDSNLSTGGSPISTLSPTHYQNLGATGLIEAEGPVLGNDGVHLRGMDENYLVPDFDVTGLVPDISQIGSDLISLFDAFKQGHQQLPTSLLPHPYNADEVDFMDGMGSEVSRRFQWLI